MESTMSDNEENPAPPEQDSHAAKARRTRKKRPATESAADPVMPGNDAASLGGEPKKEWTSKLPEPFGRHTIDIGDGRRLKLLRSNRWQQAQIVFTAPEGQDAKPDAQYTRWLRDNGWSWRAEERAWTKQFDRNTEEARYARANSDLATQQEFIELANLIRQDKGMEPVLPISQQQQGYGT
jgi:hypothetical protein